MSEECKTFSLCFGVLEAHGKGKKRAGREGGIDLECVGSLNGVLRVLFLDFLWVFGSTVFLKLVEISTDFFGIFWVFYVKKLIAVISLKKDSFFL